MTFHFLTPLWGKEYTELYVNFVLPAQINALSKLNVKSIYKIITDEHTAIIECEAYNKLLDIMPVKIIPLPQNSCKYQKMSAAYEAGSKCGDFEIGDSYIFLTPDSIWSVNSFVSMERIVANGYHTIMTIGPRLSKESFIDEYLQFSDSNFSIDARALSMLVFKHMHKMNKAYFVDADTHSTSPAAIYWKGENTFATRHFVFHPMLITPKEVQLDIQYSLDYNLVKNSISQNSEVYVVTDSDEILGIDLTPENDGDEHIKSGRVDIKHVARWINSGWPNDFHKWLAKFTVYIHSEPLTKENMYIDLIAEEFISRVHKRAKIEKPFILSLYQARRTISYLRLVFRIRTRVAGVRARVSRVVGYLSYAKNAFKYKTYNMLLKIGVFK